MSSNFMKFLKIAGLLLVLFVAFIFAASLIVDNEFEVERSIVIDKPIEEVFEYLRFLKNQDEYSVWGTLDPDMDRDYRGEDGEVGFIYTWDGNEDVGRGEQEIVGIIEGERIDYQLRFFEPFESESDAWLATEMTSDQQTRVTWGFSGSMPRPMNLMLLFMDMEEMIGSDYDTGLENLKEILESESHSDPYPDPS